MILIKTGGRIRRIISTDRGLNLSTAGVTTEMTIVYKHMLLPYDGSALSEKALGEGIALAKSAGGKITLMYVLAPHHLLVGGGRAVPGLKGLEYQYLEQLEKEVSEMLQTARQRATNQGVSCDTVIEKGTSPYEQIVEAAQRLKCDLIVMASQGRSGLDALVIGSQTTKVLTHSTLPVLVVR